MITARQFGSSLRRQRERQNITLKMVEARTKISVSLLTGLEKGDCSRWPAGIYSRAWIRAYAQAVGLDPEATVAQFAACFAETAFPDAAARSDAAAEPAPLRLSLDPDPGWRWRQALARLSYACIDLAGIAVLALIAWAFGLAPVTAAAVSAVLVHIAAAAAGHASASGAVWHVIGLSREAAAARARERARESTLAEAA